MKKLTLILLLFTSTVNLMAQANDNDVELESIVKEINKSLIATQTQLTGLSLKEATINLKTAIDKSAGGGFKIFVKASKKWSKEYSSSITYKYKTIEKSSDKNVPLVGDNLTTAILSAVNEYMKSTSTISGLDKAGFNVQIAFTIKKDTSGGVEFDVFDIGFDLSGDYSKTVAHTITLEFI